jgi:hypothetical protein
MCGYGEAQSVQWVEHPVARKEHRCCECLSVISPGERYERVSGVWEEQVELLCDQHRIGTPVRFVKVRCGCNKMVRLIEAYRCLYCGVFYCKECAEEHFGMRVPPRCGA